VGRAFLLSLAALASATAIACSEESSNNGPSSGGPGVGGSGNTGNAGGSGAQGGMGAGGQGGTGAVGGGRPTMLRFAAIGDYGVDESDEQDVADLVASWNPDFVITLGDNNYSNGEAATIDANIGKYYSAFIGDYTGAFGAGSPTNRFWPSPGNHDWNAPALQPYIDYFTLPGNERYYDQDFGLVHLFAVDSDDHEPDDVTEQSTQGDWLQGALGASTACWDFVYFHHPPYSSGDTHGSQTDLQWPFETWGADAVLAGHEHHYERLAVGGIPYFVNGLGGAGIYGFGSALPESQVRYNDQHGAMLVTITGGSATFQFFSVDGAMQDEIVVTKDCP
jgi:tartrate-resistant acid phosphatase type 5